MKVRMSTSLPARSHVETRVEALAAVKVGASHTSQVRDKY